MSLSKRSPAFDRMMEEQRQKEDNSYQEYLEFRYLQSTKQQPKQAPVNQPKGTTTEDNGTRSK